MAGTQAQEKPLRLVWREEWDAAPVEPGAVNPSGVEFVLLTHTNTDPCTDDATCKRIIRELQTLHMVRGMDDIQWNFIVGGDGRVYEGRGWELAAEKDIEFEQYYQRSVDIAYVGRFGENHVTPIMEEAVKKLVQIGVDNLYIAKNYDYIGHKEHVGFQG